MCFDDYYSAEDYQKRHPNLEYTEYTNDAEETALLVRDPDDSNPDSQFDAVLPYGDTFGWDSMEACLRFLENEGFTVKTAEGASENA